jgi:hypothetical protein
MLDKKYLKRRITGACEVYTMDPIQPSKFNGTIYGNYCRGPARFYTVAEMGMFGMYLCDEHAEKRLGQ